MFWKSIVKIILFVFTSTVLYSQANWEPVFKNGYWSVIDTSLTVLFPYKFDEVKILGTNSAIAKCGNQFLLLSQGSEKILSSNYQEIEGFSQSQFIVRKNGLCGLIDADGKEIIPCNYLTIKSISGDFAILLSDSGSQFIQFSKNMLSQRYDSIVFFQKDFYLLYNKGLFTIYNIIENIYSDVFSGFDYIGDPFSYCINPDNRKFLVSFNGKFEYIETDFFYYINYPRYTFYRIQNAMQVIDSLENKRFKLDIESINKLPQERKMNELGELFGDEPADLYAFWKNGKCGLMDANLKVILRPEFEKIWVRDSLVSIYKNDKIGIATRDGRILVPANYDNYNSAGNYWIVQNDNLYGVVNRFGKEIIVPAYDFVEPVLGNKFLVTHNEKKGLVDENNKQILPVKYSVIKDAENRLIIGIGSKYGLANESGVVVVPIKYESIGFLNKYYFEFEQQKKKGIMDANGRILFSPQYENIQATDNSYVFFVSNLEKSTLTDSDLKEKYGIESITGEGRLRYKVGLINTSGQILLDPTYDPNQIGTDFDGNTIIVKEEQGVTVVNLDSQGKLIDKIKFKNYISIKKDKEPKQTISDSLPYFWKDNNLAGDKWLIGLFHRASGRKVIDYYFKQIRSCSFNQELNITIGPERRVGIVSRRSGKILLEDVYNNISERDFRKALFARCFKPSGLMTLIDRNVKIVENGIVFMDDFSLGYMRVSKGGKITPARNNPYQIYTVSDESKNTNLSKTPFKTSKISSGGKWGIMDTTGNYTIKPKYGFLQHCLKGVFIAELAGKWGVISPTDQILIDFKYNEIRHFSDSGFRHFINTPYYKVRIKDKWGVIDSIGNIILSIEYDDVEHIYSNGKYYFKTKVDCSKMPYGIVDQTGKLVMLPRYSLITPFVNGFARVQYDYKCYKYVDSLLNVFPENCFYEARDYQDGLAAVKTKEGWGFMNEKGNIVIPNQYTVAGNFNKGFAKVRIRLPSKFLGLVKGKDSYVIINKKGEIVYNSKSRNCSDVSNGRVIVEKSRKFALLTLNGKKVLPGTYLQIIEFPGYGIYLVKNKNKEYGLYNFHGKALVPFGKYKTYSVFSEGLCYVSGSQGGFIDTTGIVKFSFKCDNTGGFQEGLAAVKIDHKWGYIDTTGQFIIQPQYIEAENFRQGLAKVKTIDYKNLCINKMNQIITTDPLARDDAYTTIKDGDYIGINDKEGKRIICPVAKSIGNFSDGFAIINIPKLYGIYDSNGRQVIKNEIPRVSLAENGLIRLEGTNEIRYFK